MTIANFPLLEKGDEPLNKRAESLREARQRTRQPRARVHQRSSVAGTYGSTEKTKSIKNAISVLLTFADASRALSVTEIARLVGLHKSTVSRQLATLLDANFVKREEGGVRYTLGLGLLPLAAAALANHRLTAGARLQLEMLARETGETVTFSGWNGSDAVNLDQVRGPGAIPFVAPAGRLNPAHCTATGKVFLAMLPPLLLERRLAQPLRAYTQKTITDPRVLRRQLDSVRANGFAVNEGEFLEDVCAIAAPIKSARDSIRYAVAVTAPTYRADARQIERFKAPLLYTAGELSRQLANALVAADVSRR